jgi:hypothetical protein
MVEVDGIVILPLVGFIICQSLVCGHMYSKMRKRIRELEGRVRPAQEAPVPSAPVDFVVVPLEAAAQQNQYLGGVTFTQPQAQQQYQVPPRYW